MKKPQLCLALGVTISLVQANMLPALANQHSIWQKMAGTNPSVAGQKKARAPQKHVTVRPAATSQSGQAMLFLSSKGKDSFGTSAAPAAALTIHPAVPEAISNEEPTPSTTAARTTESEEAPVAVAERAPIASTPEAAPEMSSASESTSTGSNLVSRLAPDTLLAQANTVTATPIPPVVTGTVDMEEFKSSNVIDLKVSQSRTFKSKNKIVRTSISDPSVAEPVVVAENQIVLLGKAPGGATLVLWDDAGNSVTVDLRVSRDFSLLQSTLREIDPRIIVKTYSVGGSDRVILLGDVDHAESILRAFNAANAFMDDRGMTIVAANSRLINARVGETGGTGTAGGGGQTGQLAQLNSVDRYTFFPNLNNNVSRAQLITSDGGRVTSMVKVRKVPLIVLHCSFIEMNSSAARGLGMMLGVNFSTNTFAFGIGGTANSNVNTLVSNPGITTQLLTGTPGNGANFANMAYGASPVFFNTGTLTNPFTASGLGTLLTGFNTTGIGLNVLNQAPALIQQAILLGAPGSTSFTQALSAGLGNLFTGQSNMPVDRKTRASVNPIIQGIIGQNRARLLAEPTLVTVSGERAAFLAGGEIPILQSIATAGISQQSVTFEPFGLRLNIIPVLLENGSINLEVSPEERLISGNAALSLQFVGSTTPIPAFTTRKSQTIVELKPGQELFISGLVSTNTGRELNKTPVYGEIPVLGSLYRSKAFAKNETELVIAVRPEVILPGTPGQLKLPEEIGRVEGPRDTNMFQVEPTIMDERHYTTGRVERRQKTSPTLPEGAPIPDNQ